MKMAMSKRTRRPFWGVWVAIVAAQAVFVAGTSGCKSCGGQDDEERIVEVIYEAADAAQRHDVSAILDLTAPRFEASPGGRDRQEVRTALLIVFERYGNFRIIYPQPEIAVDAGVGMAKAEIPFIVGREGVPLLDLSDLYMDPEGWLDEASRSADTYHLSLRLAKDDGEWLVERARIDGLGSFDGM